MIMVYVDDFLGLHRQDYAIGEVHDAFRWGELSYLLEDEENTFKGKQLKIVKNDEGRYIMKISMHKFIETVEPYKISRGRLAKDPALTDQERRDFRSVSGCLQWLGSQARPERRTMDLRPRLDISRPSTRQWTMSRAPPFKGSPSRTCP